MHHSKPARTSGDGVGVNAQAGELKVHAGQGVAVVAEVKVLQWEIGRHGLVGVLLAGVAGDRVQKEMDRAVGEDEVGPAGMKAGPCETRASGIAGAAGRAPAYLVLIGQFGRPITDATPTPVTFVNFTLIQTSLSNKSNA